MPRRRELLVNGEVYHVYNRSAGNLEVFVAKKEFSRAFELINYYRFEQPLKYSKFRTLSRVNKNNYFNKVKNHGALVEIHSFALMPDHFHLLLQKSQNKPL